MGFEKLNARIRQAGDGTGTGALEDGGLDSLRGCIGTPDQIREFVRAYEDAGVDELIFVSQAGRNRHEDICESMELFAAEVMPEFAERAPDREAAKRERYAETIERLQNFHNIDLAPQVATTVQAAATA